MKPSVVLVAVILLALPILGHLFFMWKLQMMSSGNSAWTWKFPLGGKTWLGTACLQGVWEGLQGFLLRHCFSDH